MNYAFIQAREQTMKTTLSILIFVLGVLSLNAQSLSPVSVSSACTSVKTQGAQLSYAIGQVFTPTLQNQNLLTQGVLQPETKAVTSPQQEITELVATAELFPNPASTYLIVRANFEDQISYIEIFDIQGRIAKPRAEWNKEFDRSTTQIRINLQELEAGFYILRIHTLGAQQLQQTAQFRFCKQ